ACRHAGYRVLYLDAGLSRDIAEPAVALIVVKRTKSAFEIHGLSVGAPDPNQLIADLQINLARPAHVIANKQIELAVVIIINPRTTRAPVLAFATHAGRGGDIFKFAVSAIMEKMISSHASDEHIR